MPQIKTSDFNQAQLAELHLLEAAIGGQSIIDYIPRATPVMPGGVRTVKPSHLKAVADAIAMAEYKPVRICLSVPPRHSKSELLIHASAWWLQRHPEHTIAYCSYSGDLATQKSLRIREVAERSGVFIVGGRADQWRTAQGGGLIATGVGGALTGMGCNLLLIDDPIKNREEAESITYREKIEEWFTSTAMTRPTPTGSVIVVHTRWHPDDLIGRLAKKQGWQVFNIPALDDSGHALWPQGGWTEGVLTERRREVGEYDWAALYMGQPRPKGGRMFEEPVFYDKPNIVGARYFIACDPAATKTTYSDYSVIIVGAAWLGPDGMPHIDIVDLWKGQVEQPRLVMTLQHYQEQWGCPVGIESVAGFKGVAQSLREMLKGVRILEIPALKDKFTRALPVSAAWNGLPGKPETRRIRVPKRDAKPWVQDFLSEVGEFTGIADPKDDQVDALAHLYYMAQHFLTPRKINTKSEIARYMPFGG